MVRRSAFLLLVLAACSEEDAQFSLTSSTASDASAVVDAASKTASAGSPDASKLDGSKSDASIKFDANVSTDGKASAEGSDTGAAHEARDAAVAFANCTPGADQTCNDNPIHSSLHGQCEADRTCTCRVEFGKNPATGLCF